MLAWDAPARVRWLEHRQAAPPHRQAVALSRCLRVCASCRCQLEQAQAARVAATREGSEIALHAVQLERRPSRTLQRPARSGGCTSGEHAGGLVRTQKPERRRPALSESDMNVSQPERTTMPAWPKGLGPSRRSALFAPAYGRGTWLVVVVGHGVRSCWGRYRGRYQTGPPGN